MHTPNPLDATAATTEARRGCMTDELLRRACEVLGVPYEGDDPFIDHTDVQRLMDFLGEIKTAEASKDTMRLDWLEEHGLAIVLDARSTPNRTTQIGVDRSAIDKLMTT